MMGSLQGGEMVTSAVRTIRQYCSVCKASLEMAVVDTVQDDEVTWLKCPRCNGILPHMISSSEPAPDASVAVEAEADAGPGGFTAEEKEAAVDYNATQSFEVDQVLYHRSMNVFGRIVEKSVLPGSRATVRVQLEDGSEMTLRVAG